MSIHGDGSVSVSSSGVECGQGLNTKLAQTVAMQLGASAPGGLSLELIRVAEQQSTSDYWACTPTWASGTSEAVCGAAIKACTALGSTLAKYQKGGLAWSALVAAAVKDKAELSEAGTFYVELSGGSYFVYAAAVSVLELDVLTGEYQILQACGWRPAAPPLHAHLTFSQSRPLFWQTCCSAPPVE